MHTTGKILVFMALIFSIVFMAFAVSAYATRENWQAEYAEVQTEIQQQQSLNNALQNLYGTISDNAQRELEDLKAERQRLEQERDAALAEVDTLRSGPAGTGAANEQLRSGREQIFNQVADQASGVEELKTDRAALMAASQSRDKLALDAEQLNDEAIQMAAEIARLQERSVEFGERIALLRDLSERHNLSESTLSQPPRVIGRILRLNAQERLVEISIGGDDGLKEGHELQVFRPGDQPRFLGTVRLVRVESDRAVGRVISMRAAIERDDRVTSELR